MNPIISISVLFITVLLAAGVFFFINKQKKQAKAETQDQVTAQKFTNVKDILVKYLYARDGYIFMALKMEHFSIDLFSKREKALLTRQLTADLSGDQQTFKFIAASRPVDISPLINEYTERLISTTNQKQKEILRKEISVLSNYALSGEVIERQFYLMIWERFEEGSERSIFRRMQDIAGCFENSKVPVEILKEKEIVRLCNLINNPAYAHLEDMSYDTTFPILRDQGENLSS
ncbi:hypothetical protein Desde_3152 [Desulfitobacterium dehalogenans ATCC 51507]|uniref:Uncharacterized protein n=1 Tax=Desulfitobacterium dehalogenans (strain ATCC 51507 / DSM 9161 / JW/IU-DC1) TaxID=756499 RepID=I4ABV9_DESDJ|nr:hypothetical protein [Desulfitobacterium dehalogenans]AFM01444.1 hypothetical protein Desde_3152 [Desulfitobacterium dehalogenans ATCC 51507]